MEKGWAYYAGKLFSRFLCLLPYGFLLWLGKILGFLYYHAGTRQRERATNQMMRGLAISRAEAVPVVKRVFHHAVLNMLEFFYLPKMSLSNIDKYIVCEGLSHLDQALAKGKGAILLTAHFGNWELCAITLSMLKYPMTGIGKQQPNAGITALLTEYRSRFGGEVYYKGAAIRNVIKALKKNKLVYIVSDQDGGSDGIFIDFLNKPASTPAGPAAFARKCSAPVIPVFMRRAGRKHLLVIDPPLTLQETGDIEKDIRENLVTMTKRVEEQIRRYPDEWLWFQKRWNTPGEVAKEHEQP